eukprot:3180296-Prymnesium_polylepis.1
MPWPREAGTTYTCTMPLSRSRRSAERMRERRLRGGGSSRRSSWRIGGEMGPSRYRTLATTSPPPAVPPAAP